MTAIAFHERKSRLRGTVAERANRVSGYVVRDFVDPVELVHGRGSLHDLVEYSHDPAASFPARRALAARFVSVELHQVLNGEYRVRRVGEHDRAAGPEHAPHEAERIHA